MPAGERAPFFEALDQLLSELRMNLILLAQTRACVSEAEHAAAARPRVKKAG
jgi:hypothetical protein